MGCTTLWAPLLATWTFVTATRALFNSDILQRGNSEANIITQEGAQEGIPQGNRQGNIQLHYRALFNTSLFILLPFELIYVILIEKTKKVTQRHNKLGKDLKY